MQRAQAFQQLKLEMRQTQLDPPHGRLSFGVPALDDHLSGGLACGRVHLVTGASFCGAATGFTLALVARQLAHMPDRPVIWCGGIAGQAGQLYGPGLMALGLDPARFILVREGHPMRALAAMEEALSQRQVAAVICEYGPLAEKTDIWQKSARRLQLAAEQGGALGLMLGGSASAAGFETAWHIRPEISPQQRQKMAQWHPVWQADLRYMRAGTPWQGPLGFLAYQQLFMMPAQHVPTEYETDQRSPHQKAKITRHFSQVA